MKNVGCGPVVAAFLLLFCAPKLPAQNTISCGQTVTGNLASVTQHDLYIFQADAGETVIISAMGTSGGVSAVAELYDPNGTLLVKNGYYGNDEINSYRLPISGTFTIVVADYQLNNTGEYELSLQFSTGRCSSTIRCGQTVAGSLGRRTQHDVYTLQAEKGEAVIISAMGTSGGVSAVAELFNSSGTLLVKNGYYGNSVINSYRILESGTYYIVLSDYQMNNAGGYELNLQFSTGRCSAPIACGQTIVANITSRTQHDVYTIGAPSGVSVIISALGTSTGVSAVAELFNSEGTLLVKNGYYGNGTIGSYPLTFPGTHTIVISEYQLNNTGSYELNLTCLGSPCSFSIAPASQSLPAAAGAGSVSVSAGSGCSWTAVSNAGWISVTSGSTGSGNGTVTYSVTANMGGTSRTGTLTIAGRTFTVTQAGVACSYSVTPEGQDFAAGAATGSVSVTAAAGCSWTAESNASWISITSGSTGSGNGTVNYAVSANILGNARTGTVTIAGHSVIIRQAKALERKMTEIYFPRFVSRRAESGNPAHDEVTGIAIANLGKETADIGLTAFNTDGGIISGPDVNNPRFLQLQPGAQIALMDFEVFGSGLTARDSIGWIKLESTEVRTTAFSLSFDKGLTFLDGADASSRTMRSFVLPEIEADGFTNLHIANPGPTQAVITLELLTSGGTARAAQVTRSVNPNCTFTESVLDLFPGTAPEASDYIRVNSSVAVVPFAWFGRPGAYVQGLNAQDTLEGAAVLYAPQYAVGGHDWMTSLSILNLDSTPGTVSFRLFRDDGTPLGQARVLPIAALGKIHIREQDFFLDPQGSLHTGYVEIRSDGVRLTGSVVFGDPDRSRYSTALPLVSELPRSVVFSHVASDATWYTGLAILNPHDVGMTISIEVLDRNGGVIAFGSDLIAARSRRSLLLTQAFPGLEGLSVLGGYIRVSGSAGFASFALFGSDEVLSAVPPQTVGDPSYRLHGLNFSPYMDGQDPNRRSQISPDQLLQRMSIIAPFTSWIRTFGSSDGLENAGPVARQLGLKIAAGAWLSRDRDANQRELANLIRSMKAGSVDIAIVGSEVLLRNDLSESELVQYIQQVKQQAPGIPVTTADVYSELMAHPAVMAACDLVFVNYYPYWEGIGVDNAVAAIHGWQKQVEAAAQGKPVIVSETGWPSCGDRIGDAVPSPENAAFFFLNFVSWARANNLQYFYFEAFDEDWKQAYEGPQGKCWGVWNKLGELKAGMQDVFDGKTLPDNWTVKNPPDNGTAVIEFTSVPPYGSYEDLRGRVTGVNPQDYKVAVYIYVGSGWWTKPYFNKPLTTIQADGTWICDITTGGVDQTATRIAAYLVPNGYQPPMASGSANLPEELEKSSVAKVITTRSK